MSLGQSVIHGRRVQISGSASFRTEARLTSYAHDLVSQLVRAILRDGGGLVLGAGKEPRPELSSTHAPSIVFDWTALETAAECLRNKESTWPKSYGQTLIVVTSEKSEMEIPEDRRGLWNWLLESGQMRLESILAGARSGALLRERQAQHGDFLVTLGGGTGVDHLTDLYVNRRRPVIALDIPLGASRSDGTGGSERIAQKTREDPKGFLRFQELFVGTENALLASIATRAGTVSVDIIVTNLHNLLQKVMPPYVFYTRLLNRRNEKFQVVESFFREVVDPVVDEFGFEHIDMGVNDTDQAFLNVGIFDNLHYASVVVADVSGARPNCYIELGYALGHATRTIVTAEEGTLLPFDQDAIPCHFWEAALPSDQRRETFRDFWRRNVDRPALIE